MGKRTCSIDGCDSTYRIRRGWCNAHYLRWKRHGDPRAGNASPNSSEGCSRPGCNRPYHSKGLCGVHYTRLYKTGQYELSEAGEMNQPTTLAERFWVRVVEGDKCWKWRGAIDVKGYARVKFKGIENFAHRVSFEIHHGAIPPGMDIDHKCRNRSCVNPAHLHAVTHDVNMQNLASRNAGSASGYRGVSLHSKSGKWKAEVRHRGKLHYLGLHTTPEGAAEAARAKRNELFTNNQEDRNGAFA